MEKPFWKHSLVSLMLCMVPFGGYCQDADPAHRVPVSDAARRAIATHTIRYHKLNHFQVKLETEPSELHAHCRFESDIATAPPAKRIALTFDDGPEPGETEFILATLKRHAIRATFFMIGEQAQKHPDLVAMVLEQGHHVIGNHSWDHPNFHGIGGERQAAEVRKTEELLAGKAGQLFRYPYGNSTCETNALLRTDGYKIVGWHVDSCDWAFDRNATIDAKEAAACGVLPQFRGDYAGHVLHAIKARNGGIVLMHEIHPSTLRKLDAIILAAMADGFVFGSVDDPEFEPSLR